jgi:NADH:ubiquinone oxidoreductase subunit B-like Fe-S oxidoreductase
MFVGPRAFGKQVRASLATITSGGIAGRSYVSAGGVAEVLPVDVFIPGCPLRQEAIIFGILSGFCSRSTVSTSGAVRHLALARHAREVRAAGTATRA